MSDNSGNAGFPRHSPSWFRRMTRSTRDEPHLQLSSKGKPEKVDEEEEAPRQISYVDLVTSESEQNEEVPMEIESSGYTVETDPSEEKTAGEEVEKKEPEEEEEQDQELTSNYTPLEYPIFPPLKWGTDEDKPDTWGLISPSWGLCRTAPEPPKSPENAPKPVILLRGPDTIYPGSPGYLPESIPTEGYWKEVTGKDYKNSLYRKLVRYAGKTWHLRIPTRTKRVETNAQIGLCMIDKDQDGWYRNHLQQESSYKPVKYPIFPKKFLEEERPKDGIERFIELRGKDTVLPGSPGHLPERVPIANWWHEYWLPEDDDKPTHRMLAYSEKTWRNRIPIQEAKWRGLENKKPMSEEESDAWYRSFREEGDI